jgi:hypothetical protein
MRKNHLSFAPSYMLWLLPLALLILAGCEPLPESEAIPATPTERAPALAESGPTAQPLAYPAPAETLAPYPEPWLTASPTVDGYPALRDGTAIPGAVTDAATAEPVYFPIIGEGASPVAETPPGAMSPGAALATATPTAAATATPTPQALAAGPTPTPTRFAPLDFESVRTDLAGQAQELVYNKIGLHVTFPENNKELDTYMQRLDEAGVPFFLKSVDNAEPIYRAQELMKASGVDHTLVFRSTKYDVPDYTADPVAAADYYWELEKETWPPELDPSLVWFETMNEVDRNESEWLARFSLRTAELALRDGHKWAAFGWASGEPEPEAWRLPAMLEFLRLVAEHPDQLAIALHEYSYLADDIGHDYPYKIGRFLDLFQAADENDIARPTVLITEWGWTYNNIPAEPDAMEDVEWAAELYGAYPQVKGAAIWNLGRLDNQILELNGQVGDLVDNLMVLSLNRFFTAPAPPEQATTDAAQFPPPQ